MYKTQRKTATGLKVLLVLTLVFLVLTIGAFIVLGVLAEKTGDADFAGLSSVIKYHIGNVEGLFKINFGGTENLINSLLGIGLYGLAALWVILLIVGIVVGSKKKRSIIAFGIIYLFLAIAVYLVAATGAHKYWAIINKQFPYSDYNDVFIMTFVFLGVGILYALFALITYFASIVEMVKNPKVLEEEKAEIEEAPEAPEEEGERVMFESVEASPETENATPEILEEPMEEEVFEEEPQPQPEPAPQPQEAPKVEEKVEPQPQPQPQYQEPPLTKQDLAELIRAIVREEMSRNNVPQSVSNTQGPLVVQYFNTVPMPQPQQVEQPKQEVRVEPEPKVEPVKEEPQPQPAPAPVVEPEPVVVTPEQEVVPIVPAVVEKEKKPIIRISFQDRMLNADDEMKKNYNELKNEILSYGVNSRVSNSGDAFRLHRKTYVKITIAGLSLKLYFALDPEDYKDSPIPVQDAGHKGIYAEIPLVFKVNSGLSMRRCKELIQTVMEQDGLEQGEIADTNWVESLEKEPAGEEKDED